MAMGCQEKKLSKRRILDENEAAFAEDYGGRSKRQDRGNTP